MINFAFFEKVLEVTGEEKSQIDRLMGDLARFVNRKFETEFLLYVTEKVDDKGMEDFVRFVEGMDQNKMPDIEEIRKWVESNKKISMEEFMDQFEKDLFDMEVEFVQKVRQNLSEPQKKEIIELFFTQAKLIDEAEAKLAETEKEKKKD